ncbi:MAG: peptidase MA family metallohydrolase [Planctomycetota bacterium]
MGLVFVPVSVLAMLWALSSPISASVPPQGPPVAAAAGQKGAEARGSFLKQAPSDPQALDIQAADGLEGAARRIREFYPRILRETQERLGFSYPQRLRVRLFRDHEAFNANIIAEGGRPKPDHIAAVAFGFQDLIILKSRAWTANHRETLETIFQHELVHCFLGHLMRVRPRCIIPTWLNEGLAQWTSEKVFWGSNEVLERARAANSLIPLHELERDFPDEEGASQLAYVQSLSLVRFIAERGSKRRNIPDLLKLLSRGFDLDFSLKAVIGVDRAGLEAEWLEGQRSWFGFPPGKLMEFGFGAFIAVITFFLVIMRWSKRRRLNAELDAQDGVIPKVTE